MEASERAHVLDQLTATRDKLLGTVQDLTAEQWDFQPAEGRWSIADCLEHVIKVENRIGKLIVKTLEGEPAPEKRAAAAEKEALLKDGRALDRTLRLNAPEQLHPKKSWPDSLSLVNEFENTRGKTIEFVSAMDRDLRNHFFPHLAFGDLDCYQWMMLIPIHCERHLAQIEEIKAAPEFPRTQEASA
jgi:uncharacterized damage-inducible protein DinB